MCISASVVYVMGCDGSWYLRKLLNLRPLISRQVLHLCTANGSFRVSKRYLHLAGPVPKFDLSKQVWCPMAVPKYRYTFWLAVQSKLLTRDTLIRFIPSIDTNCPVCHCAPESHSHLFFECRFSKDLISRVYNWLNIGGYPLDWSAWLCALRGAGRSFVDLVSITALQAIVYSVWMNRNTCFFF